MSSTPVAVTATALLAAAGSCLFLAGCGGAVVNDPTTTAAPTASVVTTMSPSTAPSPATTTTPTTTTTPATTTTEPCPDLPEGACKTTKTHGCLDGVSFEFAKRFACGGKQPPYTTVALYDKDTTSCCAQGIPFHPYEDYCCFDGVHSLATGQCNVWQPGLPDCGCYSSESLALDSEAAAATAEEVESAAVDTLSTTAACPCGGTTATSGCLNGHLYDFASEMPCGNYIANVKTHGCCTTAEGVKPYSLTAESCCSDGEGTDSMIRDHAHACECVRKGCGGESIFPTVV